MNLVEGVVASTNFLTLSFTPASSRETVKVIGLPASVTAFTSKLTPSMTSLTLLGDAALEAVDGDFTVCRLGHVAGSGAVAELGAVAGSKAS